MQIWSNAPNTEKYQFIKSIVTRRKDEFEVCETQNGIEAYSGTLEDVLELKQNSNWVVIPTGFHCKTQTVA